MMPGQRSFNEVSIGEGHLKIAEQTTMVGLQVETCE